MFLNFLISMKNNTFNSIKINVLSITFLLMLGTYVSNAQCTVCATAAENTNMTLQAPAGHVFTGVRFASYGNPTGSCGTFRVGTCNAPNSVAAVSNQIIGRNTAVFQVTNALFSDQCVGVAKNLRVEAIYGPSFIRTDLIVTQPTCPTPTGTITITPRAGMQYSFNGGASYSNTNSRTGLTVGHYLLKIRSISGCESITLNVTITAPAAPNTPVATVTQPTCLAPTGIITIAAQNDVQYSFDNGASYQIGNSRSGFQPGTYQLRVRHTSSLCVSNAVTATVNAVPVLTVAITPVLAATYCSTVAAIPIVIQGSPAGGTFRLDNSITLPTNAAGASSFLPSALTTGSHTLTYRATQNGCTNTATRTFAINTAPPVPTLTIVQPTVNTFGQITILNMPADATSSLNNSPASTQTVYRNLGTGNYSLVIQNSCGRSNTTFTLRLTKHKLESENAIEMVHVYPNPAHDFMDIQLSEVPNEAVTLKLYNLLGMQMAEKEVLASESLHFECGQVPNGIYQLQVSQAGRRIASRQVVIQK
jgi:hypothetical protein